MPYPRRGFGFLIDQNAGTRSALGEHEGFYYNFPDLSNEPDPREVIPGELSISHLQRADFTANVPPSDWPMPGHDARLSYVARIRGAAGPLALRVPLLDGPGRYGVWLCALPDQDTDGAMDVREIGAPAPLHAITTLYGVGELDYRKVVRSTRASGANGQEVIAFRADILDGAPAEVDFAAAAFELRMSANPAVDGSNFYPVWVAVQRLDPAPAPPNVTGVTLTPDGPLSGPVGADLEIAGTVQGTGAGGTGQPPQSLAYVSSAPGVVSVDAATGHVERLAPGSAVITGTSTADPDGPVSASVTVIVTAAVGAAVAPLGTPKTQAGVAVAGKRVYYRSEAKDGFTIDRLTGAITPKKVGRWPGVETTYRKDGRAITKRFWVVVTP